MDNPFSFVCGVQSNAWIKSTITNNSSFGRAVPAAIDRHYRQLRDLPSSGLAVSCEHWEKHDYQNHCRGSAGLAWAGGRTQNHQRSLVVVMKRKRSTQKNAMVTGTRAAGADADSIVSPSGFTS